MKRKDFLKYSSMSSPALLFDQALYANSFTQAIPEPFVVESGQSRFGDVVKFMGLHPNDLKISSKDTGGQLSVFEYTGLAKVGPPLHLHYAQDEIFTVLDGEYRFVCGDRTYTLRRGQTIFLPKNLAHTWLQLSDTGKLIYMLQPAGQMEAFFARMNQVKAPLSAEEISAIHEQHGMKVVGPPLVV